VTRILNEPLLHFAVLGIGLFVLYRLVSGEADLPTDEIVVDTQRVAALAEQFARTRQRPPTQNELEGLVDTFVRDEVLYREGVALGLDRDDPVIRNRVRLKMEVLSEGLGVEVTDPDLQAWLDANADRYTRPARYDVRQIFFDPEHRAGVDRDVEAALRELQRSEDTDWSALGDATLLPAALSGATESDIAAQFGAAYSAAMAAAPRGRWFGPVASAYGLHIVHIDAREERRAAALNDVRDEVERDVRNARSEAVSQALYERLRTRYTVRKDLSSGWFAEALAEDSR